MTRSVRIAPLEFRDIDEVADALRDGGGRFSASRRIVLEALFAADEPLSAEQVAGGTGGAPGTLDATTVYRILERLEELGVVRHVHLGHGPGLYALTRDGGREYLVCDGCDRVTAVNPSQLDHVRDLVRETFGFEASFTHFPLVGLCAQCVAASPAPSRKSGATMHDHADDDQHSHEHSHGDGVTHSHAHTDHDHEHLEHEHEHSHEDGVTHSHPHVHQDGIEEDHGHEH